MSLNQNNSFHNFFLGKKQMRRHVEVFLKLHSCGLTFETLEENVLSCFAKYSLISESLHEYDIKV